MTNRLAAPDSDNLKQPVKTVNPSVIQMEELDVSGRIRTLRKDHKMTQAQLAKIAGVSAAAVTQWEGGAQKPKAESLSRLADHFGVNAHWLLTGVQRTPATYGQHHLSMDSDAQQESVGWGDDDGLGFDNMIAPFYTESLHVTKNSTTEVVVAAQGRKLRFAQRLLTANGVDTSAIACAINQGKSMERLIMDGALIALDTSKQQVKDDRIFAFDHGGMLRVKYLFKQPKGGLLIRSENRHDYPDEILSAEEFASDIRILGWVFDWSKLQKW